MQPEAPMPPKQDSTPAELLESLLSEKQKTAVLRAALAGEYHLFMGAGASRDSTSRDGQGLPSGDQLAVEIAERFGVVQEKGDQLWRVYSRAVESGHQEDLYRWLRNRFSRVDPPHWMDWIASLAWSTVWTLNVDDSFEQAYRRVATDVSRQLRVVSWDDEFRTGRELDVVHLHGHVEDEKPRSLIFSLTEYAESSTSRAAWPLTFRDLYGISPTIFVGARLRDEPDIEAIIAGRTPTHAAPNMYVSPTISPGMTSDLKNWGIIPVPLTAEEFAEGWATLIGADLSMAPSADQEIALRVGFQFQELRTDRFASATSDHDLLGGDEPVWADIVAGLPADLDWIREAKLLVNRIGVDTPKSLAVIYTGNRLSGSSTGLLAVARAFRGESWRVFKFTSNERPDTDAIIQFAADGKSLLLVFDGISEHAEDVAYIVSRARDSAMNVVCLAVDRRDRVASIAGRIPERLLLDSRLRAINSRLTSTDAARLVDRLATQGRLGKLEPLKDGQRLAHFRGSQLFASMAELEDAPGFGRRVATIVDKFAPSDQTALELVLFASLASRLDRDLLLVDAARMVGIQTEAVLQVLDRSPEVATLLLSDGVYLRSRQRWMALDPVLGHFGPAKSLDIVRTGIERIAPRLSRSSQRERNATGLWIGALMAYRNLSEIFGTAGLREWFEALQPHLDWSGRFWEQRAIMERLDGSPEALGRAESYARRAVTRRPDSYSFTTLGTVLAARLVDTPLSRAPDGYARTRETFQSASDLDPTNLVTWLAFLRHTLPFARRLKSDEAENAGGLMRSLRTDWTEVWDRTIASASADESLMNELRNLRSAFPAE